MSDQSTTQQHSEAADKGKGKATEAPQDLSMGEEESSSDEEVDEVCDPRFSNRNYADFTADGREWYETSTRLTFTLTTNL